jgi:hypothetical protein
VNFGLNCAQKEFAVSVVSDVLEAYDAGLTEEDVAQMLREALGGGAHRGATTLTAEEVDFLTAHAGVPGYDPGKPLDVRRVVAARLEVEMSVVATSLSTEELGSRLGIDGSRVRHRARDGSLYSVRVGRALRFPLWQFDDQLRTIPGLRTVLAALPKGLHPAEVEGWMTNPDPDLIIDEEIVSVRDWLLRGGDAGRVVELSESLTRW